MSFTPTSSAQGHPLAFSVRIVPGKSWSPYVRRSMRASPASYRLISSFRPRFAVFSPITNTPDRLHALMKLATGASQRITDSPAATVPKPLRSMVPGVRLLSS